MLTYNTHIPNIKDARLETMFKEKPFMAFRRNRILKDIIGQKTVLHDRVLREIQIFLMHFCPGTMTTHAESISSHLQRGLTGQTFYDTQNIEHRTEPVSH